MIRIKKCSWDSYRSLSHEPKRNASAMKLIRILLWRFIHLHPATLSNIAKGMRIMMKIRMFRGPLIPFQIKPSSG